MKIMRLSKRKKIITLIVFVIVTVFICFAVSLLNGTFSQFLGKFGIGGSYRIVGTVDQNNDIILNGLPNETYILYYENENGIIDDYQGITVTDLNYTGLIKENVAPMGAEKIGVYDTSGTRVGSIYLGSLKTPNLGKRLYSNATVSDIHLQQETAVTDFQKAFSYFNSLDDLLFVNICGDLTDVGSAEELQEYKDMRDTYSSKPVYAVSGNHESIVGLSNWTAYTGHNPWYSYKQGDDVYIMLGMTGYDQPFSNEELQWLYETLEENRNNRCFVYQHVFPWGGSGDAAGLNGHGDLLDNASGKVFLSLMSHYKNVIWFHGHSHQKFAIQEQYPINNIDSIYGRYSVHIPSLALPREIYDNEQINVYEASEGYVVDVYENGIILRGRDFVDDKFLPLATFYLDTTLQTIAEETYTDPTGVILNKNSPKPTGLPNGSQYLVNQRYSESGGGIIDAVGYVSLIIPCAGDGDTPYTLQIQNTNLDLSNSKSTFFLLDENQKYAGVTNGSKFISKMSGVKALDDGTIQVEFIPTDKTAFVVLNIDEKNDIPLSVTDITGYAISLKERIDSLSMSNGTVCEVNRRYSESSGGMIDSKGFASFVIPCSADGRTRYILELKNTDIDITQRDSMFFLLDDNQKYLGTVNGSKFFSEMAGITVLDDGIQLRFTPSGGTAYIIASIAVKDNVAISFDDVHDYSISLTPIK